MITESWASNVLWRLIARILFLHTGFCHSYCSAPSKRQTVCLKSRCPHMPLPIRFTGSWSWPDGGRDRSVWQCSLQVSMPASPSLSLIEPVVVSLPCTRSSRLPCHESFVYDAFDLKIFTLSLINPRICMICAFRSSV